jgi:DNA replication protein DnaC
MISTATSEKLYKLKLSGMAEGLAEQLAGPIYQELSFAERFGMLVDREQTYRDNRRLKNLLKGAKLRHPNACLEEIDFRTPRGLSRDLMFSLAQNAWVAAKQNVVITGPTGSGKTFIACALANSACRGGVSAFYIRLPRLLQEMHLARADGSYGKLLIRYARIAVLVLDDWGLAKLTDRERRDLLEILEDRYRITSTIISSQLPPGSWHDIIGDPTIADAVLDRVIHNAHTISLSGESMRKTQSKEL